MERSDNGYCRIVARQLTAMCMALRRGPEFTEVALEMIGDHPSWTLDAALKLINNCRSNLEKKKVGALGACMPIRCAVCVPQLKTTGCMHGL